MKVFISWSGDRSKRAAEELAKWLRRVIHGLRPWISSKDLQAGDLWSSELATQLQDTNLGIICLTPENLTAPWLLYETGALAKAVNGQISRACPYLLGGLTPSDLPQGPLSQFHLKEATEEGTRELVHTINRVLRDVRPDSALADDDLDETFKKWWPDLEKTLVALPRPEAPKKREERELLEEVLELVRGLARVSVSSENANREEISKAFAVLTPREEQIVRMRFGIDPSMQQRWYSKLEALKRERPSMSLNEWYSKLDDLKQEIPAANELFREREVRLRPTKAGPKNTSRQKKKR